MQTNAERGVFIDINSGTMMQPRVAVAAQSRSGVSFVTSGGAWNLEAGGLHVCTRPVRLRLMIDERCRALSAEGPTPRASLPVPVTEVAPSRVSSSQQHRHGS